MMANIRAKDTQPELILRKEIFRRGFRYRLHDKKLPGKPDIVFPGYRAVVFVHGCFWHGHNCPLFKLPSTRTDFWKKKIERNRRNDLAAVDALVANDWRVATVWECALKGRRKRLLADVATAIVTWLQSDNPRLEIRGQAAEH